VEIVEGYGLTETAPVVTSNAAGARCKPGTVGPAIPGVAVRPVDEDDRDVPRGAPGELICRGENVMAGYWRQPEATAEALRGGWFHTGDSATVDADGYYTIVDRKKDMINAGGFKVWPREVEEVLYAHPAVRDAAVVAMPDPYAGERPLAVVALKDGQSADSRGAHRLLHEPLGQLQGAGTGGVLGRSAEAADRQGAAPRAARRDLAEAARGRDLAWSLRPWPRR
jgi:long-chain acyl-CoA synthetase